MDGWAGSLGHWVIGDEGELVMIGPFFEDQDFASVSCFIDWFIRNNEFLDFLV